MVLRVFFISSTGRRDIRKRQIHVFAVLSSWKFEFERIDVAAPENEKERDFVIESGKKTDEGKIMLPQIFKEEECCGDYADFLQAIEHEKLQLFLKQITQEEFDALEKTKSGESEETKADEEGEKAEGEEEDAEKEEGEEDEEKKEGEEEETEDGEKEEKTEDEENKEEGEETTKGKIIWREFSSSIVSNISEDAEEEDGEKTKDEDEEEGEKTKDEDEEEETKEEEEEETKEEEEEETKEEEEEEKPAGKLRIHRKFRSKIFSPFEDESEEKAEEEKPAEEPATKKASVSEESKEKPASRRRRGWDEEEKKADDTKSTEKGLNPVFPLIVHSFISCEQKLKKNPRRKRKRNPQVSKTRCSC